MKKAIYYILMGLLLLILSACESGAELNMVNRTSYPVNTSVDHAEIVSIPEGQSHVFKIDTDTQSFLTGEVKRKIPVWIVGETFSLYDRDAGVFVDSTEITVKAGKTTNAFLDPNRASIKIVNNSDEIITQAIIKMIKPAYYQNVAVINNIQSGESISKRVKYATFDDPFYYKVEIWFENATEPIEYGNSETVLANDQQWVVEVE
ncbi:MAG: hypothetical protein PWP64_1098 [Candidatus Cloacimonadota bacterium]|nr:hypothetical protein [Candidatus Cloacimonadota bacterium]